MHYEIKHSKSNKLNAHDDLKGSHRTHVHIVNAYEITL